MCKTDHGMMKPNIQFADNLTVLQWEDHNSFTCSAIEVHKYT
jgi:hypothetical protein